MQVFAGNQPDRPVALPAPDPVVRTVRGDIDPALLGPPDAREHLFFVTPIQPGDEFADVDRAILEAATLAAAGARSLVDWTPLGLGRDPDGLRRASEATGLNIVPAMLRRPAKGGEE
jgi:phosphotriesterase-related protein